MAGVSTRQNFEWGHGTNESGSTVGWTPDQWADYEKRNGLTYQDPNAPTQQTEEGGGVQAHTNGGFIPPPTDQASAATQASVYSATPAAAPTQNTTNQGSQDIYRNALIQQMTQNPIPDANDPAVRAQADPMRAAFERAQGQQVRSEAEHAFGGGQDYGTPERAAASERAGQQTGLFESQLVGRELQSRRQQIQQAMQQFGSTLSGDQMRDLQKQLADLDAQIKREGLAQTGSLGSQDIGLRRDLGTGQLNLGMLQLLLGNQLGYDQLGGQMALGGAGLNRDALLAALGG